MAGTILPIVYGSNRRNEAKAVLWLHASGYLLGAAALGGIAGEMGKVLRAHVTGEADAVVPLAATGAIGLLFSLMELDLVRLRLPQSRWQVPASWFLLLGAPAAAFAYGGVLGMGLPTRITVATFYVPVIWALLSGRPLTGVLALAGYGVGRILSLKLMGNNVPDLAERSRQLRRWRVLVHVVNGALLAFTGAGLLVWSTGWNIWTILGV